MMRIRDVINVLEDRMREYGNLPVLLSQPYDFFATMDETMSFGIYCKRDEEEKPQALIIGPYQEDFSTPDEAMEEDV